MGNSHPNQIKAGRGMIDVGKVIKYQKRNISKIFRIFIIIVNL